MGTKKTASKKKPTPSSFIEEWAYTNDPLDLIEDIETTFAYIESYSASSFPRNEKILRIPMGMLVSAIIGYPSLVYSLGIPIDSTPLRAFVDHTANAICVILHHPSFDTVAPGAYLPIIDASVSVPATPLPSTIDDSQFDREV